MAAEVTSKVNYNAVPVIGASVYVLTYSKANAGDTIDVSTYFPQIKTIIHAKAQIDAAGADDPLTWSSSTVTFTTGTGAGRLMIVGVC